MSYTLGAATPGASGNALIHLDSATALDAQTAHTVMVWYKPKTYNTGGLEHGIVGAGQQTGSWPTWAHSRAQWRFGQDNSIIKLSGLYKGSSYSSAPNFANPLTSTSTWYHIAVVVTPGTSNMVLDVYVNATLVATLTASGTTFPTADLTPIIGSVDYDYNPADGSFAGWRAWQASLTQPEIAAEMDAAAAVKAGAIIDLDLTSSSATNLGSGGTWAEGGNGSWTYNSTGGPTVTNPGGSSGTDVAPVGATVASSAAVASISAQTDVAPVGSTVASSSPTAQVTASAAVQPVGATSASTAGTASVSPQADVSPVGATSASVAGTASVSAQADIAPTGTTVASSAGIADVGAALTVNPVGATSASTAGTAQVTATANVTPSGAGVAAASAVAAITATTAVTPTGAVAETLAGTAAITATATIQPVTATVTTTTATGQVTASATVIPVGVVVASATATADVGRVLIIDAEARVLRMWALSSPDLFVAHSAAADKQSPDPSLEHTHRSEANTPHGAKELSI